MKQIKKNKDLATGKRKGEVVDKGASKDEHIPLVWKNLPTGYENYAAMRESNKKEFKEMEKE